MLLRSTEILLQRGPALFFTAFSPAFEHLFSDVATYNINEAGFSIRVSTSFSSFERRKSKWL